MRTFQRERVPRPTDYSTFGTPPTFNSTSPTHLEIGCGVGLHPIQFCQQNPEQHLIAIEHTFNKFQKFKRRYEHHTYLHNLFGVHTNAISYITHEIPNETIQSVFILYPNPEPQNPAKRWFRMSFFSEILRVLKPDGQIQLATNEESYLKEACDYAQTQWLLTNQRPHLIQQPHQMGRTHFEIKYLQRKQSCYEVIFKKVNL
jgi:tRNA G46 methylase TrmB